MIRLISILCTSFTLQTRTYCLADVRSIITTLLISLVSIQLRVAVQAPRYVLSFWLPCSLSLCRWCWCCCCCCWWVRFTADDAADDDLFEPFVDSADHRTFTYTCINTNRRKYSFIDYNQPDGPMRPGNKSTIKEWFKTHFNEWKYRLTHSRPIKQQRGLIII